MFIDGYGFFAACRKIASLAILLAFSSSAQAILVSTPLDITLGELPEIETFGFVHEHSLLIRELTIIGSTQTSWSLVQPNYGRADFVRSAPTVNTQGGGTDAAADASTVTVTYSTVGKTVFVRYTPLKDPYIQNIPDSFEVIIEDGGVVDTLTAIVSILNNPPIVRDSEEAEITSPTAVGTYASTFVVGGVSTTVFSAYDVPIPIPGSPELYSNALFFTWSIIPNVDSLATVSFANTEGSQFISSFQGELRESPLFKSEVGVVYESLGEDIANAGYTLVVKDTLGRAATVTVLLTPESPVIRHEGSPVEDGELAVSIDELGSGSSFELSAEYPCPPLNPKCLFWSGDGVDITSTPTAGGDTVTVTVPEGTDVDSSFPVKVVAYTSDNSQISETTVNVTIAANMDPKIVSIDGQTARRTFSVSGLLDPVRFYVVATDDFDPESMTWAISDDEDSTGRGTASFVVMDGMMESTATTARGSKVRVDFRKGTVSSSFTLTVMDRAGGSAETTVTVNPNPPGSPFSPTGVEWNTDVFVEGAASNLALTFRAISAGLGETDVLRWSAFDLDGLVVGTASSVTTGPEGKFVVSFANPSTQFTGTFRVRVVGSYSNTGVYSRRIRVSVRNEPPIVTYQVGDVSSVRSGAGGIIDLQEGEVTTAISFSAYDPIGQLEGDSTLTWVLGEQRGLRASFVRTNEGENVVVRFDEEPVEGSYFVILVTNFLSQDNTIIANAIRVNMTPASRQLRIRTFLGGAVR